MPSLRQTADIADRRELLGPALRVTESDVTIEDVDVLRRDVRVELPALLEVATDLADRIDEVRLVVAHRDAGDANAERLETEQLPADNETRTRSTRAARVDDRHRILGRGNAGEILDELAHRTKVAPAAERIRAALGDDVRLAAR
jgi:hypothetical protein